MTRFERHPKVDAMASGKSIVLYHRESCIALVLNQTAGMLWDALNGSATSEMLANTLKARHPSVAPEQVRADADKLLGDLHERGFVLRHDA